MKKLLFVVALFIAPLFGEVEHLFLDQKILDSKIKIIDIRTPGEWKETGLIKDSIPIMFFDERGNYDLNRFLKELNGKIDTKTKFAMICNSGSRTRSLSEFLSKKYGYDIIDLSGGIRYAMGQNLPITPLKP
jgi:rhodanese-related sulfurtransferase